MISIRDLHKHYGDIRAVDGISFDVAAGEIFGLLGPNGAGKTTTLRVLATLTRPTEGKAEVNRQLGRSIRARDGARSMHNTGSAHPQVLEPR